MAGHFAAICGQDTFRLPQARPAPSHRNDRQRPAAIPQRALMVGDSQTDIDTAKAAGIPVVAVDFGYTDRHVREFEPSRVISHFDELTVELVGAADRRRRGGRKTAAPGAFALTCRPRSRISRHVSGLQAGGRAISSAGEHTLHTGGVAGSIPASPTIIFLTYKPNSLTF